MIFWKSFLKLGFFLFALPATITIWHVSYTLQQHSPSEMIFVTVSSHNNKDNTTFNGLYKRNSSINNKINNNYYFQVWNGSMDNWPFSMVKLLTLLFSPPRVDFTTATTTTTTTTNTIQYQDQKWILSSSPLPLSSSLSISTPQEKSKNGLQSYQISDTSSSSSSSSSSLPNIPKSGTWESTNGGSSNPGSLHLQISELYLSNDNDNDKQRKFTNKSLLFILNYPTTTIFMLINVGLFLYYWNYRITPSTVALNEHIFQDYGRAFSGSLAHFDLLHIGFNIMSWMQLGEQLEPVIGSLRFFIYTSSFIPLTTLLLLGLRQLHIKYANITSMPGSNDSYRYHLQQFPNIVGFSGVLFAWMVVATLLRGSGQQSCPIFFLPTLCFSAMQIMGIPFHISPLIQLVVAQIILPRACFTGHLAGVIIGFCFIWNILPPLEWLQPAVLLPIIWMFGKRIIYLEQFKAVFLSFQTLITFFVSIIIVAMALTMLSIWSNETGKYTMFIVLLGTNVILLIINQYQQYNTPRLVSMGLLVFNLFYIAEMNNYYYLSNLPMLFVHGICWICFQLLVIHDTSINNITNEQAGIVGRGLIVVWIVLLLSESMTMGIWFVTRSIIGISQWSIVGMRWIWTVTAVITTCHVLVDRQEWIMTKSNNNNNNNIGNHNDSAFAVPTIMYCVFGYTILEPCKTIASTCATWSKRRVMARHATRNSRLIAEHYSTSSSTTTTIPKAISVAV